MVCEDDDSSEIVENDIVVGLDVCQTGEWKRMRDTQWA